MTQLSPEDYLEHIRSESARFREVLSTCDPAARVPSCPDWSAADLLWHMVTVQWFWATAVIDRPAEVDEAQEPERPEAYDDLLRDFDQWSSALVGALEGVDKTEEAWTWSGDPVDHTIGFILRRQAHEALIHRIDAELAAGVSSEVPAELAADGVDEVLAVMYGGCPPWGSWSPLPFYARIDATDTGDETWIQLGLFSGNHPKTGEQIADEEDLHVVAAPDDIEPDVVVDGPAAALDTWLWHRADDSELSVAGDRAVLERFLTVLKHPIN
jgi:uncharacterized protein (TIGR03083 family)